MSKRTRKTQTRQLSRVFHRILFPCPWPTNKWGRMRTHHTKTSLQDLSRIRLAGRCSISHQQMFLIKQLTWGHSSFLRRNETNQSLIQIVNKPLQRNCHIHSREWVWVNRKILAPMTQTTNLKGVRKLRRWSLLLNRSSHNRATRVLRKPWVMRVKKTNCLNTRFRLIKRMQACTTSLVALISWNISSTYGLNIKAR